MIDIGVNLSNPRFAKDTQAVLTRAQQAGVEKLILTGTSIAESRAVSDLCAEYASQFNNMLFSTAGIHPHDAKEFTRSSINDLRELAAQRQVVALGEMGLDFNRNFSTPKAQERRLRRSSNWLLSCGCRCFYTSATQLIVNCRY